MKKIHVIIPVVQTNYADELLKTLARNTVLPEKIVIIDNSEKDYIPPREICNCVDTEVYPYDPRKRTNESWKIGFEKTKNANIVSILNDDIIVSKYFFEKILIAFGQKEDAAIVSPLTRIPSGFRGSRCRAGTPDFPNTSNPNLNNLSHTSKRQGWPFSIRRDILDKIPPIPDELTIFCGDDWLSLWVINMGFRWYIMLDNRCFHYVGSSISQISIGKGTLKAEKRILQAMLKEHPDFKS